MTRLDPHTFAIPMIDAVRAGSRICRAVQSTLSTADSVSKDDKSPVTVADLATHLTWIERARQDAREIVARFDAPEFTRLRDRVEARAAPLLAPLLLVLGYVVLVPLAILKG